MKLTLSKICLMLLISSTLLLTSCSSNSTVDEAQEIANLFIHSLNDHDFSTATDCLAPNQSIAFGIVGTPNVPPIPLGGIGNSANGSVAFGSVGTPTSTHTESLPVEPAVPMHFSEPMFKEKTDGFLRFETSVTSKEQESFLLPLMLIETEQGWKISHEEELVDLMFLYLFGPSYVNP